MIKRLYFDLESSPNIGLFWTAGYKQNISYDNIIKERAIICICYKWQGQKKIHSLTWDKNQCDKGMLKEFIKVANQADEIVGHNGDKFDLPWVRTRCLLHNIPMFPTYVTVDTLKLARSKFRFNSNRLDYIGKYLGLGEKIHTSFDMWKDIVLHRKTRVLNDMVRYCKGDVDLLEKIYVKMHNHFPVKSRADKDKLSCPECGGNNNHINLTRTSAAGVVKKQRQCLDCNKYYTTTGV